MEADGGEAAEHLARQDFETDAGGAEQSVSRGRIASAMALQPVMQLRGVWRGLCHWVLTGEGSRRG